MYNTGNCYHNVHIVFNIELTDHTFYPESYNLDRSIVFNYIENIRALHNLVSDWMIFQLYFYVQYACKKNIKKTIYAKERLFLMRITKCQCSKKSTDLTLLIYVDLGMFEV